MINSRIKINLLNKSGCQINEGLWRKEIRHIIDAIVKILPLKGSEIKSVGEFNIVFISEKENLRLNKAYRQLNKVCESLVFLYDKKDFEADILITFGLLKKRFPGSQFKDEFRKVMIHAFLHAFGYDHEKELTRNKMQVLEVKINELYKQKKMKKDFIVGLDIGSFYVKTIVAQLTGNEEYPYQIVGVGRSLAKGIKKGGITDMKDAEASVHSSLELAEKITGVPIQDGFISISGDHITSTYSKGVVAIGRADGEITLDDVDRVLNASQALNIPQNKEIIHVLPQKYFVDDNHDIKDPVGMSGVRLGVESLIVEGMIPNIKTLIRVVENSGVNVQGMVVDSLAASYAILNKKQKDLGVVLINIGATTTSLIVYEDGEIKHLKVLPIGSGHITNDIAIGLRTTIEVAEKIKVEYGVANPKEVNKREQINLAKLDENESGSVMRQEVAMIIEARLEEIFRMVNKELQSIQRQAMLPSGAVLTGGGARLRGIIDSAKDNLKLPAQIGFPLNSQVIIEDVDDPLYATSVGLIMWQIDHGVKGQSSGSQVKQVLGQGFHKVRDWVKHLLP